MQELEKSVPRRSDDAPEFRIIVNDEEQYSLWLGHKEIPAGWRDTGTAGSKEECLAYVREVWTDMRPLSLRKRMAEARPD